MFNSKKQRAFALRADSSCNAKAFLLNQCQKRLPFLFRQLHAQAHTLDGLHIRYEVRLHAKLRKVVFAHTHPRKGYRHVRNLSVVISEK